MSYTSKRDKVYNSWRKMLIRCTDRQYHSYHRYGGRGIRVSERWQTFDNFWTDMGPEWFEGATLDRSDNDGDYTRDNCRWQPATENKKPYKYDMQEILAMANSGMPQRVIGEYFNLTQDRISKLLKKARSLYGSAN